MSHIGNLADAEHHECRHGWFAPLVGAALAAIRVRRGGRMGSALLRTELVHEVRLDDWCVALDGRRALRFSGPGARDAAEQRCAELEVLINSGTVPHRKDRDERIR